MPLSDLLDQASKLSQLLFLCAVEFGSVAVFAIVSVFFYSEPYLSSFKGLTP